VTSCPTCGRDGLARSRPSARLAILRCPGCGHRVAEHAAGPAGDYHEQYEAGAFLEALRATRVRQAGLLLSRLRACAPPPARLLDFGCGRGWFLEAARAAGLEVAGADTSALAIRLLGERGIPGLLLAPDGRLEPERLPFRPDVVTLLDVIEHFPPEAAAEVVAAVVRAARPRLVLAKVPVSGGLLYRTAAALARAGVVGPLEQLYQVGTEPPHRSYFSDRSARALLARAGLRVVDAVPDLDFEPAHLAGRARALARLPAAVGRLAGGAAGAAARALGWQDAMAYLAEPAAEAAR
jgi:SAM-dependent methyltransferase